MLRNGVSRSKNAPLRFFIEKAILIKDDVGNFQIIWILKQDTKASPNSREYIYRKFKELFKNLFFEFKKMRGLFSPPISNSFTFLYKPHCFIKKNYFFQRQGKLVPNRLNAKKDPKAGPKYDRMHFLKV